MDTSISGIAGPTRTSRAWAALGAALVLLLVVIVFVAQNGAHVDVRFLWLEGTMMLGLALLLSAVLGGLVVLLLGLVRIMQLRRAARRHVREHDA